MAAAVELQGHIFALDGVNAALMADTPASLVHTDPPALRDRFREQGYLLVRELLPRPLVAAVEAEIRALAAAGPQEGLGRGMLPRQHADTMMNSATFRRVSHGPELFGLFDALFDEPSVTLDYKHFRAIGPGNGTPFHMDRTYMGRGSRRLTTAWIPWHDIDLRTGGVAVVEGSTSLRGFKRVRETYGEQEVHGMLSSDPHECLSYDPAARWLTADYRAGDVLVFPMDLLHGSCTNRNHASAPLRLSSDIRFQPQAGAKHSCCFSIAVIWARNETLKRRFVQILSTIATLHTARGSPTMHGTSRTRIILAKASQANRARVSPTIYTCLPALVSLLSHLHDLL